MLTPVEWMLFIGIGTFAFLVASLLRKNSFVQHAEVADMQLEWLPVLELETLSGSDRDDSQNDKVDLWLHRIVSQSGTGLNVESFLLIDSIVAFLIAGITLEFLGGPFVAILAGAISFAIGVIVILVLYSSRQKKFAQQFPVVVDLIACSVGAGQSLQEAIETAIDSVEDPASSEFLRCSRELSMGMSASKSVQRLARRIPSIDVKIFAHTITVHEEMGGQLGATLKRMSGVIRQRSDDIQKARAATSLGRFAAATICSIGVIAVLYLVVFEPEYIGKLLKSQLGQRMAMYAVVSEIIGIACVLLALQSEG